MALRRLKSGTQLVDRGVTGGIRWLADELVARAGALISKNPPPQLPTRLQKFGSLVDVAAADGNLVETLRRFKELQLLRHQADYDHDASFDKATLLQSCEDADHVRARLNDASEASRQALFTMLVVQQDSMHPRE